MSADTKPSGPLASAHPIWRNLKILLILMNVVGVIVFGIGQYAAIFNRRGYLKDYNCNCIGQILLLALPSAMVAHFVWNTVRVIQERFTSFGNALLVDVILFFALIASADFVRFPSDCIWAMGYHLLFVAAFTRRFDVRFQPKESSQTGAEIVKDTTPSAGLIDV